MVTYLETFRSEPTYCHTISCHITNCQKKYHWLNTFIFFYSYIWTHIQQHSGITQGLLKACLGYIPASKFIFSAILNHSIVP